jgi:predicted nuclease with TOPRIM domain
MIFSLARRATLPMLNPFRDNHPAHPMYEISGLTRRLETLEREVKSLQERLDRLESTVRYDEAMLHQLEHEVVHEHELLEKLSHQVPGAKVAVGL